MKHRVDSPAVQLRGFGPLGIAGVLVVLAGNVLIAPLSAVLVLAWAKLSETPWPDLGFSRPRSWVRVFATGIPLGILFKLVMKAVVMPLFGAPPLNTRYHYLAGNTAALPGALFLMIVVAGFGEETVFRGFLFERMRRLLGDCKRVLILTIALTSAFFASAHYPDQGLPGVEQAAIMGVVFGTIFAATGQLWIPMIAHALFDITAVLLIYLNWESAVAHVFFDEGSCGVKYLLLAYGSEDDWNQLSESEQQSLLAQDEMLRQRGSLVAAVATAVTTVRAWDGTPRSVGEPFGALHVPLAGFGVIEADDLDHAIELVAHTPCARARGAVEIRPILQMNQSAAVLR